MPDKSLMLNNFVSEELLKMGPKGCKLTEQQYKTVRRRAVKRWLKCQK